MELARRVREHLEDVRLLGATLDLVRAGVRDLERVLLGPDPLPLLLDRLCVVALHPAFRSISGNKKSLSLERLQGNARGFRRARSLPYASSCAMNGKP